MGIEKLPIFETDEGVVTYGDLCKDEEFAPYFTIMGTGELGIKILNHIFNKGIWGVENFVVFGEDEKVISASPISRKIKVEHNKFEESKENFVDILKGFYSFVLVADPKDIDLKTMRAIVDVAKELEMLTIYAVPYLSKVDEVKMKELEEIFDSIFIIVTPDDMKTGIVKMTYKSLKEILEMPLQTKINPNSAAAILDFEEFRDAINKSGKAFVSIGESATESTAVNIALKPLLEIENLSQAKSVLVNCTNLSFSSLSESRDVLE